MSDDLQVYGRRKGKHRVVRKSDYKGDVLSPADRKAMAAALKESRHQALVLYYTMLVMVSIIIGAVLPAGLIQLVEGSVPRIYFVIEEPTTTHKF